jgi:signal transduction histidine kinase
VPRLVGREVSSRAIATVWERVRRSGLDPAVLATGTGRTAAELTNPRERVPWSVFHRVMTNLGEMLDDGEIVELGRAAMDSPFLRALLLPGRYLMGLGDVYRWCFGPRGPSWKLFAVHDVEITEVDGRIGFEILLKPGYPPSRENFLLLEGTLIALGTAVSGRPPPVQWRPIDGGAFYEIRVPERRSAIAALRELLADRLARPRPGREELRRAHDELHIRYAELEREVEARLQVETQLQQSRQRTGDIAHDFNNLLTAIIMSAQVQLRRPEVPEQIRTEIGLILEAAHRGAELIRQLAVIGKQLDDGR